MCVFRVGRGLKSLCQSPSSLSGPPLINCPSSSSDSSHFKEDSRDTFPTRQKNDIVPAAYQASPLPFPVLNLGIFALYSCLTLHDCYQKSLASASISPCHQGIMFLCRGAVSGQRMVGGEVGYEKRAGDGLR